MRFMFANGVRFVAAYFNTVEQISTQKRHKRFDVLKSFHF
jgi:hypothetical protein